MGGSSLFDPATLLIVALIFVGYSLVSARLASAPVTAPLVFMLAGLALGPPGAGLLQLEFEHGVLHTLAELALVVALFTDAARIDPGCLRQDHDLALRMLLVGIPGVILAGTLVGWLLLPGWSPWLLVLLAAILAPTDASLGQAAVTEHGIPLRVRQTLNVESGLNDGLLLPAVLLLACLASAAHDPGTPVRWLILAAEQIGYGIVAGAVLGSLGGWLVAAAAERRWMTETFLGMTTFGLALSAFAGAESVGGNGFVAAFVAGAAFARRAREQCRHVYAFAEAEGQLLVLLTFLVLGVQLLPAALTHLQGAHLAYGLLSLTLVRLVPAGLALAGCGLRPVTIGFIGWFGPRGLASLLFGLFVIEDLATPGRQELFTLIVLTVALSVVLHGVTAAPLARWYARRAARLSGDAEHQSVRRLPLRLVSGGRRR
ncbi:MAG: cation:proton antiporter [Candidatus Competibacterales bacterium]|nr:cation:proton antiporter [Candidatus Competibacterales bacterium]